MDRKSSTSTAGRVVTTISSLILTIAPLAVALLNAGKRKRPYREPDSADHREKPAEQDQRTISVLELKTLPAAIDTYETSEEEQTARDRRRFWVEVVGVCLVFITAGLAGLSAWFLHDQTRILKDQVHSGQRAYLLIEHLRLKGKHPICTAPENTPEKKRITEELTIGHPMWLEWDIKNTGQTPARNIHAYGLFYLGRGPIALQIPPRNQFTSVGSALGPKRM